MASVEKVVPTVLVFLPGVVLPEKLHCAVGPRLADEPIVSLLPVPKGKLALQAWG